jgi:TrmH family RNA methyltransferase
MNIKRENISIVLVEPEVQGNIGAVSRAMKNTFFNNLIIIGTSFLDDDAFARAKESDDILQDAIFYKELKDIRSQFDVLIGTSAVPSGNMRDYRRIPMRPGDFWEKNYRNEKKTAIIMGREGDGLKNSELELCDFFLTIQGNPEYPIYNLSHALTIILYESILNEKIDYPEKEPASGYEMDILLNKIMYLAEKTNFSPHKIPNTRMMIRRILSRSDLAKSEFYRLMGLLRKIDLASSDMRNKKDGSL